MIDNVVDIPVGKKKLHNYLELDLRIWTFW